MTKPDADGWIEWTGITPKNDRDVVEVQHAHGVTLVGYVEDLEWRHCEHGAGWDYGARILRYRLLAPVKPAILSKTLYPLPCYARLGDLQLRRWQDRD
jgi:hypothetical protein